MGLIGDPVKRNSKISSATYLLRVPLWRSAARGGRVPLAGPMTITGIHSWVETAPISQSPVFTVRAGLEPALGIDNKN